MPQSPEAFLDNYPPDMRALADRLRVLVKRTLPESIEEVKPAWMLIGFYMPAKPKPVYVGFILPHADSVSFGFQYGTLLDDPNNLLLGAGEKLKRVRYFSLRSSRDLKAKVFTPYIRQAAELALMPKALRQQVSGAR
jgi:hypothetical protein